MQKKAGMAAALLHLPHPLQTCLNHKHAQKDYYGPVRAQGTLSELLLSPSSPAPDSQLQAEVQSSHRRVSRSRGSGRKSRQNRNASTTFVTKSSAALALEMGSTTSRSSFQSCETVGYQDPRSYSKPPDLWRALCKKTSLSLPKFLR